MPEVRKFAQDNMKQIMDMYCDQDILILLLNAPFIVRLVLAFATTFMARRQSNRIKVFSSATGAEAQKILRAVGPQSMFPESLGGGASVCELNALRDSQSQRHPLLFAYGAGRQEEAWHVGNAADKHEISSGATSGSSSGYL